MSRRATVALVLGVFCALGQAPGQMNSGEVAGTVQDPSG